MARRLRRRGLGHGEGYFLKLVWLLGLPTHGAKRKLNWGSKNNWGLNPPTPPTIITLYIAHRIDVLPLIMVQAQYYVTSMATTCSLVPYTPYIISYHTTTSNTYAKS